MHAALLISALAGSALSMPISNAAAARTITTGLMSIRSASPIHFATINATQNEFWIFKPTTTFCYYSPPDQLCSYPNTTLVDIYPDSTQYQVYMDANVPGGQNVYVGPTGALSFTSAHAEYVFPNGSYTDGFQYTTNANNVSLLTFTNGGASMWLACPATEDESTSYQVFADVKGFTNDVVPTKNTEDCLPFGMVVANSNEGSQPLGAFQYS